MKRGLFTLIELLVVIAIIAILMTLLLPALGKARALGKSALCASNEKQLGLAYVSYLQDYQDCIPLFDNSWPNGIWIYEISPYVAGFDFLGESNKMCKILRCPEVQRTSELNWGTDYAGNQYAAVYYTGVWPAAAKKASSQRSLSSTVSFLEFKAGWCVPYSAISDLNGVEAVNCYRHSLVQNTLFFDGHVERFNAGGLQVSNLGALPWRSDN